MKNNKHSQLVRRKIVLTGGHAATTALATIEALHKKGNWDIYWIGSPRAVEGEKQLTLEFREFPKLGIRCYAITAGRVQRKFTRHTLQSILRVPVGFVHALYLILKIRPEVIISYGGFAAFPVVVIGWLVRCPVIVHEQTIAIGLANKYSIPFATKIALSRKQSLKYYPKNKSVITGNPIRSEFYKIGNKSALQAVPFILATGGSRGARIFNKHLIEALPKLLVRYRLVHQSGEIDYKDCKEQTKSLPKNLSQNYTLLPSIPPTQMYQYFNKADIIIGRAGANTVAEVIASGRPAIFMPIPWSQNDEQTKNAEVAAESGQALIIAQKDASGEILFKAIDEVAKKWAKMSNSRNNEVYELDRGAAMKLASLAEELLHE